MLLCRTAIQTTGALAAVVGRVALPSHWTPDGV
jgi:hypothetical protein